MGLDMYVYRVEKLNTEESKACIGKHKYNFPDNYAVVLEEEFLDSESLYKELLPYMTRLSIVDTFFDFESACLEHGISSRQVWGMRSGPDGVEYSFDTGEKLVLKDEEYCAYCYDKPVYAYIWKKAEVIYWRKAYDLQELICGMHVKKMQQAAIKAHDSSWVPTPADIASWQVENCGYYKLSAKERKKLYNAMEDDYPGRDVLVGPDKNLFYLEWY